MYNTSFWPIRILMWSTLLIVSAMKIYITLKKSWPKRFIMKKVRAFWNRPTKISRPKNLEIFINIFIENSVENFRYQKKSKFSDLIFFIFIQCSMKCSKTFFDLKKMVGRFQNALSFFIINRFGQDFSKLCRFSCRTWWKRFPGHWSIYM